MKASKHTGFTLIELLVVISIIGVLMSMLMVSVGKARSMARRTKAQAEVRELAKAWKAYWLTYGPHGGWPETFGHDVVMDSTRMAYLLGNNARGLLFISAPEEVDTDGFRDPWGTPYHVDFQPETPVTEVEHYHTTVQLANRIRHEYD